MSTLTEFLDEHGIGYETLAHDRTFTGLEEARELGIEAHAVLKTLLLDVRGEHVAAVLPSEERLDMKLVRDVVEDPGVTLADEAEITRDFGDFELGALPPIAPLLGIDVIVDPTVPNQGPVIFAAGSQTESVKVDAEVLFASQPVRFAKIADVWTR